MPVQPETRPGPDPFRTSAGRGPARRPRAGGPDWTVVRAPMLTDGPRAARYRTAVDARLPRPGRLSRADLAHYLLAALEDRTTHRAVVEIGS